MSNNIPVKPADAKWTDAQWHAIYERDKNILVAAAAGSGKTAVLVERIIQRVLSKENPVDVDKLLVVTFTKAAAQEMKHRLAKALETAIQADPNNAHLKRQSQLVHRAQISTLHSFCLQVIRSYSFLLDFDPGFRMGDETETDLLLDEVIEEILEEEYSVEDNTNFFNLVDCYTNERGDDDLHRLLRKLYRESLAHPFMMRWLHSLITDYDVTEEAVNEFKYVREIQHMIDEKIREFKDELRYALQLTSVPNGPYFYEPTLQADLVALEMLQEANNKSFTEGYTYYTTHSLFGKLASKRDSSVSVDLREATKECRDHVKKSTDKFFEAIYKSSPSRIVKDAHFAQKSVTELVRLVTRVHEQYRAAKKDRAIIDFNDLEHFALEILVDERSTENEIISSEIAVQLQKQYDEIYIDEYQDVNFVQETVLQSVSNGHNMFMVGDVKQSIYRFRLAEPKLFMEKYALYRNHPDRGIKIDLSQNFRSRNEIITVTNYLFYQIMSEETAEIDYDEEAELRLGATYYPAYERCATELLLIEKENSSADEEEDEVEDYDTAELEGKSIALKIMELMNSGYEVYDAKLNEMRPIQYRDIVILVRSTSWSSSMMATLKEGNIPVYADLARGYFEAIEIQVMLNYLRLIDNPRQDIPLASILRSPIVGLTENELIQVRSIVRGTDLWSAIEEYVSRGEKKEIANKLERLLHDLELWREKMKTESLSSCIWGIFQQTGYYHFVGALQGGRQRKANLRALFEKARQFETTSFRGLFRFLRYIERLQERGDDFGTAPSMSEQEDVVQIMTIHKSKGLEFPVVFVANIGKQFNEQDLKERVLLHKEHGFTTQYIDPEKRLKYATLPQEVVKEAVRKELRAEEMRVLYVALTRAKEKLFLVGTVKNAEKALMNAQKSRYVHDIRIPSFMIKPIRSYLQWILFSFLRHSEGAQLLEGRDLLQESTVNFKWREEVKLRLSVTSASELPIFTNLQHEEAERRLHIISQVASGYSLEEVTSTEEKQFVHERMSYTYPYQSAISHASKVTVTEVKRQILEKENGATSLFSQKKRVEPYQRPKFLQKKELSPTERGTAMHTVMQSIPIQPYATLTEIEKELEKLVDKDLLTKEESEAISVNDVFTFWQSEIGETLLRAERVYREVPFTLILEADELYEDWHGEGEEIIIQGMLDCLFYTDGQWILLDYKTDQTMKEDGTLVSNIEEKLKSRYRIQMDLYQKAVERIIKIKLNHVYLYFFNGSHTIEINEA